MHGQTVVVVILLGVVILLLLRAPLTPGDEPAPVRVRRGPWGVVMDYRPDAAGAGGRCCG